MNNIDIKAEYLNRYRLFSEGKFQEILRSSVKDKKKRTAVMNRSIKKYSELIVDEILDKELSDSERLNETLFSNYASYIVMLEYRNKLWKYTSMDFARRVGELWEPFCKIPFQFPVNELKLVEPVKFQEIEERKAIEYNRFVSNLKIRQEDKEYLYNSYKDTSKLLDSGAISLSLDLHFTQGDILYNVDYKSGFNSNEKGNTNRLLLVGSIYKENFDRVENIILVRQRENNHYLDTLKNSHYWNVYIENEAYDKINEFTGFDFRNWIDNNITWIDDLSEPFVEQLRENNLIKYLTW